VKDRLHHIRRASVWLQGRSSFHQIIGTLRTSRVGLGEFLFARFSAFLSLGSYSVHGAVAHKRRDRHAILEPFSCPD
jgi:hypothetical protein